MWKLALGFGVFAVLVAKYFSGENAVPGVAKIRHDRKEGLGVYDSIFGSDATSWRAGQQQTQPGEDNHGAAVEIYFTMITDFFEWGWADAFHMAPMNPDKSFEHSMNEWEIWFANRAGINKDTKVADMGMGVGGPMRRISQFTGANITGVTICAYQIERAHESTPDWLEPQVKYVEGDYNATPLPANHFDVVYFMESLSHSNDRAKPLAEAFRIVKPGGTVAGWQWMLKDDFDYENDEHMELKRGMEYGGGLSNLNKPHERIEEFERAGLVVTESFDGMDVAAVWGWGHWSVPLIQGHDIFTMFASSWFGRRLTMFLCTFLEGVGIAAEGTTKLSKMLEHCGFCAAEAGKKDIFTPLWFTKAYKPME